MEIDDVEKIVYKVISYADHGCRDCVCDLLARLHIETEIPIKLLAAMVDYDVVGEDYMSSMIEIIERNVDYIQNKDYE